MKIKAEAKIGIIVLATFLVVYWGINYLKGRNILKKTDVFYTVFNNVQGLDPSAAVMLNGYKVGLISGINFKKESLTDIIVSFSVDHKFNIPKGSLVELFSADMLGTKALQILPANSLEFHNYGDTLKSTVKADLISSLTSEFIPLKESAENLIINLDSVVNSLGFILNVETSMNIQKSFANLESSSRQLNEQLNEGDLKDMLNSLAEFSNTLNNNKEKLDTVFNNMTIISDSIASANIKGLISSANNSFANLAQMLDSINYGQGSLGKFSKDDSVYNNLNASLESLNLLLEDLKENPDRYVQFSIFGGKNKSKKD